MRLLFLEALVQLALFFELGFSGTVYITDLPIYSALAPCAGEAVSYVVQGLTNSKCPTLVSALESCACTQDQNSAAVASSIASNIANYCGGTATEDQASASFVFSAYCNQAISVTVPKGGPVTQFVTDLPAFSGLGGCAQDALSYAVQGMTESLCPPGVSLLPSCACTKDQNSLRISEAINSNVGAYCGTTHTEDVASAQAVFAGYCEMDAGTTSFASPSYLKGDVTYFVTDLPTYSSLASCAREAVSYPINSVASKDCPADPLGLVSCVCVKDGNSQLLTSALASQIKDYCGSTASADVTSALGVFAYYCSAGNGLVTPVGVTASVTTTPYGTGAGATKSRISAPTSSSTNTDNTGSIICLGYTCPSSSPKIPLAAIIGGSIGAGIVVICILLVGWRYRRRHYKPRQAIESHSEPPPTEYGKAELPGGSSQAANRLSKSPILRKPTPNTIVSPVSPIYDKETAALAGRTEMEAPGSNDVPTGPTARELHPEHARYEVQGQPHAHELVSAPRYEVQGSNPPPSANMNDGPFYELEGPYR